MKLGALLARRQQQPGAQDTPLLSAGPTVQLAQIELADNLCARSITPLQAQPPPFRTPLRASHFLLRNVKV